MWHEAGTQVVTKFQGFVIRALFFTLGKTVEL